MRSLVCLALLALAGCSGPRAAQREVRPGSVSALHFIENDYPAALAKARARGLPLFVDLWTTWCHTCLSMRAYVFPDPVLAPLAAQFVWLSVDAEDDKNALFVARYPSMGYPTLFVLDADSGEPLRRWMGSYTAPELASRLTEVSQARAPGNPQAPVLAALAAATRASQAHQSAEAERNYHRVMADAAPGTLLHSQAVEGLLTQFQEENRNQECIRLVAQELPSTPPGTSLADQASLGVACALELPATDPDRSKTLEVTAARAEKIALDPNIRVLADDRSDLFRTLVDARQAQGNAPAAQKAAVTWRDFLEAQAAQAQSRAARAVFDAHRFLVYRELHEMAKAVPMLEESERDFPADYNPPARLAMAFLELTRPAEALVQAERALKLVYGPRTLRVLLTKADAQTALKDGPGAAATLARAEQLAKELPARQQDPLREEITQRRALLRKRGLIPITMTWNPLG